jgi:hypothetical protein
MLTEEEKALTESLKTARGQEFWRIHRKTYYAIGPKLTTEARRIKLEQGKIVVMDVAILAIQFNLCLKHCFDFLEDRVDQVLPSGSYKRLQDRGLKATKIMREAAEKLAQNNTCQL